MLLHLAMIPFFLLPWHGHPAGVSAEREHIGRWTLSVGNDRFTGGMTCRLYGRNMDYERHAVVFRLPAGLDTSGAVYRVDDGEAIAVRDEVVGMARQGFDVYRDDLGNPSGGLVRVPERRALRARTVKIKTLARGPVATFRIEGLDAALEAARKAGCPPTAFNREAP
jgi:hypothetical protein